MTPLTVGSLFTGIGGIDLGLQRAGMTIAWHAETDPYCQRVLAKHWPHVPNLGDVTSINWEDTPRVDVICGGFPCPDISQAGKRAGLAGARSGLWRIFPAAIRHLRPDYVLVENVADLAVRGLDTVLGDLAALGYDTEWQCIPAASVGAPHRRDRIFIVAYPDSTTRGRPRASLDRVGGRALGPREPRLGRCGRNVADPDSERLPGSRLSDVGRPAIPHAGWSGPRIFRSTARPSGQWPTEPDVGRVADGVPARLDRLRALGNAVVPQVAEHIGHLIAAATQQEVSDAG
jgi:DNA (cytosine-5)-methyltransferase 1